jgi:four helix bundle protein
MANSFRDLTVWQRAVQMTVAIYKLTEQFPKAEVFGLSSQLRRSAVSVASNIAEGYGRATQGEYVNFLGMARGSNCEIQTQLIIASELSFGDQEAWKTAESFSHEVGKMLTAIIKSLQIQKSNRRAVSLDQQKSAGIV